MSHKHFHHPLLGRLVELVKTGILYEWSDVPRFIQMPNGNVADTYLNCHLTDCGKQSCEEMNETARLLKAVPWKGGTDYGSHLNSVEAFAHRYRVALEQLEAA